MTKTIFCDIDGTIFKHKGDIFKNILEPPELLNGVIDKSHYLYISHLKNDL